MKKITAISICSSFLLAGIVDEGFSYQDYLDFGQNKGRFKFGARNIYIDEHKNGQIIRHSFNPEIYMPDFVGTTDKERGDISMLYGPYVLSAFHVIGNIGRTFTDYGVIYKVIKVSVAQSVGSGDNGVYRVDKFITGLTPPEGFVTSDEKESLTQKGRYSQAWRSGTGVGYYKRESGDTRLGPGYAVRTGGRLSTQNIQLISGGNRFQIFRNDSQTAAPPWIPFSALTTVGDSGSPLFLYDTQKKKWVVAGNVSAGNSWHVDVYATIRTDLIQKLMEQYATTPITLDNKTKMWGKNGIDNIDLKEKDLFLKNGGTITLAQNINQGVGGIYFQGSKGTQYTINGESDTGPYSWRGGGLSIDEGVTVHWKVKGIKGILENPSHPNSTYKDQDTLHKIGKGTLSVEVENDGWLNLGEGTVVLDTSSNAFEKIILTSGRGTLQLAKNKTSAIDLKELFFLFRGGALDLNGNNITFENVINHNDNGAKIINSSSKLATLHIKKEFLNSFNQPILGSGTFMYHGDIGDNIKIYKNGIDQPTCPFINTPSQEQCKLGYGENLLAFDGEILNPRGELEHINGKLVLQGHPVIHAYLDLSVSNQKTYFDNVSKIIGEEVLTVPSKLDQQDWETRRFILNKLTLSKTDELTEGKPQSSTFVLGRNALLFTDLFTNQTKVYFGGKQDLYIDRYDGENIPRTLRDTTNKNLYTFKQTLTKGPSQKDDSFYFEGNITGSNASSFYISNTKSNPLKFGSFVGFDRSDITLQQRANVNYKVSLDSSSRFYAKYIELWGSGENEAILDFATANASCITHHRGGVTQLFLPLIPSPI